MKLNISLSNVNLTMVNGDKELATIHYDNYNLNIDVMAIAEIAEKVINSTGDQAALLTAIKAMGVK